MKVVIFGTKALGGMDFVIKSHLNSELREKYDIKYIPTHFNSNPVIEILFFVLSIVKSIPFLLNKDYNIFHMHISQVISIYRKMILILFARIFRKKVILHTHGSQFFKMFERKSNIGKRLIGKILNSSDAFVVLSNIRMEEYSRIVEKSKIRVIHNFIEDPHFTREFKKKKIPVVITLGRVGERKGTELLVQAVDCLKNKEFTVIIYGDGEVEKYRNLVEGLGLKEKVRFPGWISGECKINALKDADMFVLPSYNEDLPISIIEAMAFQLPIISTTTGSIREQVYEGVNGFIITPGDRIALVDALRILIEDAEEREHMGKMSYRIFKEKYDQDLVLKQISELYDELGDTRR